MIKHVCYACNTTKSNRNHWYTNRDLETDISLTYLCNSCYNSIIRRPKRFNTKEERSEWIREYNKGRAPPNKGKRSFTNRKCDECGSTKTVIDTRGIEHWRHERDENGRTKRILCNNCSSRLYGNKSKWKQVYQKQRVSFKRKDIHIDYKPRVGRCSDCGCSVEQGEIKRTVLHHEYYDDNDIIAGTVEICQSCHSKRHGYFTRENR